MYGIFIYIMCEENIIMWVENILIRSQLLKSKIWTFVFSPSIFC